MLEWPRGTVLTAKINMYFISPAFAVTGRDVFTVGGHFYGCWDLTSTFSMSIIRQGESELTFERQGLLKIKSYLLKLSIIHAIVCMKSNKIRIYWALWILMASVATVLRRHSFIIIHWLRHAKTVPTPMHYQLLMVTWFCKKKRRK